MSQHLCITATFLAGRYHGNEWPPSPARLFQALLAGVSTGCYKEHCPSVEPVLRMLEELPAPEIVARNTRQSPPYRLSVPNNDMDRAARNWAIGKEFKESGLRTMKIVRAREPFQESGDGLHVYYLWRLADEGANVEGVRRLASFLHTFGWGIDMAYAESSLLDEQGKQSLTAQQDCSHYVPASRGELVRDVPTPGYLKDLKEAYQRYCSRLSNQGVDAATRATRYGQERYRRVGRNQLRVARFLLRRLENDNAWFAVPWAFGMRIAAWMRHAVSEALQQEGYEKGFIDSYVLGHGEEGHKQHLAFIPVPTVGTIHADGAVRRVMLLEPPNADDSITELLQWKLAPSILNRLVENGSNGRKTAPVCSLVAAQEDGVWPNYLPEQGKCVWHSVTPVILHGHNSLRRKFSLRKTEELLFEAFEESGYPRPSISEFFFQAAPFWPGTEAALAMRVPEHLSKWPRYHVAVRFREPVNGPVVVGIGRHYGIGLFAAPSQEQGQI
jgi:CRISPR-associated protein Csb2